MTLGAGETFAGYTILGQLGAGGMGEVYLARHPRLPRQEALKILRADISNDDSFRQRFIREADSIAALDHPNIVTVYDRGDTDNQLWIATQYIEGTDAARLLRSRYPAGMPADEVADITTAIANALDYAHRKGLLHRDVKPANILLSQPDDDGNRRTYLADFGIARPLDDPAGLTATNFTLGTLAYAAPEQLMGQPIDGRADQYALAATAYHLITGQPLYSDTNPVAVISQHLTAPPPPPSSVRTELAPFDAVFARALAKQPQDRFPRCQDFAHALTATTTAGSYPPNAPTRQAPTPPRTSPPRPTRPSAAPPTASTRTPQPSRGSRKLAVIVGGVSVLGVLGIGGVLLATTHRAGTEVSTTTTPSSSQAPYSSSITGTCDQQKICHGAKQRAEPKNDAQQLFPDILPEGASVEISCQIRGELKTETDHAPSDLWYRLTNGAYINSIYITPPGTEIPTCTVSATAAPPPPPTTTRTTIPAADIRSLLLTNEEIQSTAAGLFSDRPDRQLVSDSTENMTDYRDLVDPPECTGVLFGNDTSQFTPWPEVALIDQTTDPKVVAPGYKSPYATGSPWWSVDQTAALFTSAAAAQQFVERQTQQWVACTKASHEPPGWVGESLAGKIQVNQFYPLDKSQFNAAQLSGLRGGFGEIQWTIGDVTNDGSSASIKMVGGASPSMSADVRNPGNGSFLACQVALAAKYNAVLRVRTCQDVTTAVSNNPAYYGKTFGQDDLSLAKDYAQKLLAPMLARANG